MFKKIMVIIFCAAFLHGCQESSSPETKQAAAVFDFTPFFKNWENGCDPTPELAAFLKTAFPEHGANGSIELPETLKGAMGNMVIEPDAELNIYVFPFQNSIYYGLPLKNFTHFQGKGSGFFGYELHFNATSSAVQQALAPVQYKKIEDEVGEYVASIVVDEKTNTARLVCDFSM